MNKIRDKVANLSSAERAALAMRISRRKAKEQAVEPLPPAVQPDPANRFAPFPLTDLQQAYWVGRSSAFEIGNVASHCYLELEADFDLDRLTMAWRKLVDRHDMLRGVINADGAQLVLESVPDYEIQLSDLSGCTLAKREQELDKLYAELSHQILDPATWPMFDIRAASLPDGQVRLFFSIDALIADGWSLYLIFHEWASLYNDPGCQLEDLEITFRDYVLAEKAVVDSPRYADDRKYWQERLDHMTSGPDLPLAVAPNALSEIKFERRVARLDSKHWGRLKDRCNEAGLTYNAVLIAAYTKVIAMWSQSYDFLLSVPQFNRNPLHPQVNKIVGEAASFLPLQLSVDAGISFAEQARRTQERLWHDLDHSNYTGVQVLRDISRRRESAAGVLVPVIFTAAPQLPDGEDASVGVAAGDLGRVTRAINQTSQVWLDNHVSEQGGELVCDWDSVVGLFPENVSAQMLEAYMQLLRDLADHSEVWETAVGDLSACLLPEGMLEQRVAAYTEQPIPDELIFAGILRHAEQRPDALALVAGEREMTYADLEHESAQWARDLVAKGVSPGDLVAVCMEKGWQQVVAVLAILRAGAAYVPIDVAVPDERFAYLLEKTAARITLTQSWLIAQRNWPVSTHVWAIDQNIPNADDELPEPVAPESVACVIFTSGSTGLPKGVMLSHSGAVNSIACTLQTYSIDAHDRILGVTALHHDMSIFDLFGVLGAGGVLILPEPAGRRDPAHWSALMQSHDVTLWNSVPAMMEMLLEYSERHAGAIPQALRIAFLGGDWIPLDVPSQLAAQCQAAQVVSVGGPTETTLWNIWHPVAEVDPEWKSIPYGRPIANTRYFILDAHMQECPDWVTGIMHVSGSGVSLGYLGDPEQTAEKFVAHPVTGERLFRTGDQGRWRADGTIEFMGRADFQVKVQGQRIEPGEIETVLRQHPEISQAVVLAVGERLGQKKLVAYIVPNSEATAPEALTLREYLATQLAEHMIPAIYVVLESLPLTANGKVDRSALPAPAPVAPGSVSNEVAASGNIKRVLDIVADVLNIEAPQADINLMSLGANSIDMVRIGNRLEAEFGSRPRMDEIFRLQTAAAMSGWYDEQSATVGQTDAAQAPQSSGSELVDRVVKSTRVMLDPAERDAFKESRPAVRKDLSVKEFVELPREITEVTRQRYRDRRSFRNFPLKPVSLENFSQFIGCMAELEVDGNKHKFLYASPGGLNPVQVYFHIKPGRITGIAGGTYYYHPEKHGLMRISDVTELDRDMHIPFINTPIFDECAFSVYLVADLNAIVPSYGDRSMHFISLEVGTVSQLLESAAVESQIGLCQIGTIEFERIAEHFDLTDTHMCVHSMVGGGRGDASNTASAAQDDPLAKASELLRRVKELSDAEARDLLQKQEPDQSD